MSDQIEKIEYQGCVIEAVPREVLIPGSGAWEPRAKVTFPDGTHDIVPVRGEPKEYREAAVTESLEKGKLHARHNVNKRR